MRTLKGEGGFFFHFFWSLNCLPLFLALSLSLSLPACGPSNSTGSSGKGSDGGDGDTNAGNDSLRALGSGSGSGICPEGFIPVPPLKGYTKKLFCVAKYEMKNDGSDSAVSQTDGRPWAKITKEESAQKCRDMGAHYSLILNDEWQTLARNIELVAANWHTGVVGASKEGLNGGHAGIDSHGPDPSPVTFKTLSASDNDDEACFAVGRECDGNTWHYRRRTHTLSNGEVIWDVAGNVDEWILDDQNLTSYSELLNGSFIPVYLGNITDKTYPKRGPLGVRANGGGPLRTAKGHFGPSGDYNHLKWPYGRIGDGSLGSGRGPITRGSSRLDPLDEGIFNANLGIFPKVRLDYTGFRCVYHPLGSS